MQCNIEWNGLDLPEWERSFSRIRRSTLLQSYDYACAVCPVNRQRARWGLIRIDGVEAGLVQILEAGIFGNMLHALVLDRGPLWLPGFGAKVHNDAFFAVLNRESPARFGRRRRIIPEIQDGSSLEINGFRRLPRSGYQTIWLDLTPSVDDLRAGLKAQWRNKLGKAERHGIAIEWDEDDKNLPMLLTKYQSDRSKKGYDGPSPVLLQRLAAVFAKRGKLLIGRALLDNQAVAAILVLCHGASATYQMGWSLEEGRKTAAHNMLLWQAACRLKTQGYIDFDLGGVNDETEGLTKFKEGMGGEMVAYAGHYV